MAMVVSVQMLDKLKSGKQLMLDLEKMKDIVKAKV
jgi:hypothetical protein